MPPGPVMVRLSDVLSEHLDELQATFGLRTRSETVRTCILLVWEAQQRRKEGPSS